MERLIDKLRKIEALARTGTGGERENAQRMLVELCQKHDVTLEQIIQSEKKWYDFPVRDAIDEMLLTQVVLHICMTPQIENGRYRGRKVRCFKLTPGQSVDIKSCYEHYRKAWRRQLNDLMIAFIHSNKIYGPRSDQDRDQTPEEIEHAERIMSLMQGMKREQWDGRKRIEGGTHE